MFPNFVARPKLREMAQIRAGKTPGLAYVVFAARSFLFEEKNGAERGVRINGVGNVSSPTVSHCSNEKNEGHQKRFQQSKIQKSTLFHFG